MPDETPQISSLCPQQKFLWRARQKVGECQNVGIAVRIDGAIDATVLASALAQLRSSSAF